jgi:predicted metalloprotease with PDZ domain
MPSISHRVRLREPGLHLLDVETTVRDASPLPPLTFFLPVWAPGSYLVREFARHVEAFSAEAGGREARARKVRKNAWHVAHEGARAVTIRYRLWANELSVRTNHVDATHAFLNGAATFMAVEGFEAAPCTVHVDAPDGWRVATALRARDGGGFEATGYDELVDAPIDVGTHDEERFDALGKPHRITFWPGNACTAENRAKLARDFRAIVEAEAHLFGGALPYDAYLLLMMLARGRGGLEHASSAALMASPSAFGARDTYLDLLALAAHETFHAWNVKRIRPAALTPYRYDNESYTRLLWWFEGATSYYDWLTLRRAQLCTAPEYLEHLAGEIAYLDATPGRLVQSLEEASFDAWIKLYRPDENTANSSVSYYRKGELVCAMADLEIRARSDGRASLDDALRALWNEHGRAGVPVAEDALEGLIERATGVALGDLWTRWLRSTEEIDYDATLAHVGLRVDRTPRVAGSASLGLKARADGGRVLVSTVSRGGAAHRAGIDVGDELLAIGGKRVEGASLDAHLAGKKAGVQVEVVVSRDGRVATRKAALDPGRPDRVKLVAREGARGDARARLDAWLGGSQTTSEKT